MTIIMSTNAVEGEVTSQIERDSEEPLILLPDAANAPPFYRAKHTQHVETLAAKLEGSFEGAVTNHLRLSGVYWSVTTMFLLCNDDIRLVDEKMGLISPPKRGPTIDCRVDCHVL